MQKPHNSSIIAQIKLTASIIIWGGSFIATKYTVTEVSPITVIWLRFMIGLIILGIFARRRGDLRLDSWKDASQFIILGLLGITLPQWMQARGLVTSDASTTAWISSTTPIFMAILGWLFLKEKLTWSSISGILLAGIGVLLVISKGKLSSLFANGFGKPGDIIILISAPVWAIYSIFSRPSLQRHSVIKVTFYTILFGWMFSSIEFALGSKWTEFNQLTLTGWSAVMYLGVFCSALAYIFYNDGLQSLSSSQVGAYLYIEPLVATLVSAVLLSEQIVLATIIGGAFILFGIWLVNQGIDKYSIPDH